MTDEYRNALERLEKQRFRKVEKMIDDRIRDRIGRVIEGGKVPGGNVSGGGGSTPLPTDALPPGGYDETYAPIEHDHDDSYSALGHTHEVTSLDSAETNTALVLKPDGTGGVSWNPEAGGGGGGAPDPHASSHAHQGSDAVALDASQITSGQFADGRVAASNVSQHAPTLAQFSDHSSRHVQGGADAVDVADLGTAESNTSRMLSPDGTGGVVWVEPSGGGGTGASELDDLTDVDTTGKADGDLLVWNASAGEWQAAGNAGNGGNGGSSIGILRGVAEIEHPSETADIIHGAAETPARGEVQLTPSSPLYDASQFWLSDIGASTFRVNLNNTPGTGNTVEFDWMVLAGEAPVFVEPPVVAGSSSAIAGGSTSIVVPVPSEVEEGDLLVAFAGRRVVVPANTAPGWTLLHNLSIGSGTTGSLSVQHRRATASEPASYTFDAPTSGNWAFVMVAFRNVHTVTPFNTDYSTNYVNAAEITLPSIDVSDDNSLLVIGSHILGSIASMVVPSPFSIIRQVQEGTSGRTAAAQTVVDAGPTGTVTYHYPASGHQHGILFALRGAA